jgi:hypothetical protein
MLAAPNSDNKGKIGWDRQAEWEAEDRHTQERRRLRNGWRFELNSSVDFREFENNSFFPLLAQKQS